jgi:hypothetical protein
MCVFIPIGIAASLLGGYGPGVTNPPIPEPEAECLTLARWGEKWGLLWTLADEEDLAPEAAASLNWLTTVYQGVGRRHILAHGFQYGEALIVIVTHDHGKPLPDLGDIERHDWTSALVPP